MKGSNGSAVSWHLSSAGKQIFIMAWVTHRRSSGTVAVGTESHGLVPARALARQTGVSATIGLICGFLSRVGLRRYSTPFAAVVKSALRITRRSIREDLLLTDVSGGDTVVAARWRRDSA
ncbi:MAG TPA: hypothetical protein VNM72_13125 [Blastocatellia bacterium]|nr:hypothetical protein [Blastocatellia bacterium]